MGRDSLEGVISIGTSVTEPDFDGKDPIPFEKEDPVPEIYDDFDDVIERYEILLNQNYGNAQANAVSTEESLPVQNKARRSGYGDESLPMKLFDAIETGKQELINDLKEWQVDQVCFVENGCSLSELAIQEDRLIVLHYLVNQEYGIEIDATDESSNNSPLQNDVHERQNLEQNVNFPGDGVNESENATFAQPTYKIFDNVPKKEKVKTKIEEFNDMVADQNVGLKIPSHCIEPLVNLMFGQDVNEDDIALLLEVLQKWPEEYLFPFLDIARKIILNPVASFIIVKYYGNELLLVLRRGLSMTTDSKNLLLTFKCLANMFLHPNDYFTLFNVDQLEGFSALIENAFANQKTQLAIATYVLNSCVYSTSVQNIKHEKNCLCTIKLILELDIGSSTSETKFRIFTGLRTLLASSRTMVVIANQLNIKQDVQKQMEILKNQLEISADDDLQRVLDCIQEVLRYL